MKLLFMKFLKKVVQMNKNITFFIFFWFFSQSLSAQIFLNSTDFINPTMRNFTPTSLYSDLLRYGEGGKNSLHCALKNGAYSCTRIHDGIVVDEQVVFPNYQGWSDNEYGDVQPQIAILEDGSAVAVQPRPDRRGIIFAQQRLLPDGRFSNWIPSATVTNTEQLYNLEISLRGDLNSIRILTWRLYDVTPERYLYPMIRDFMLTPTSGGLISSLQKVHDLRKFGMSDLKLLQTTRLNFRDPIHQRTIHIEPGKSSRKIFVCEFEGECFSNADLWIPGTTRPSGTEAIMSLTGDIDKKTGTLSFLFLEKWYYLANGLGHVGQSGVVTLYPVQNQKLYVKKTHLGLDNNAPLKVKSLGDNKFAYFFSREDEVFSQLFDPNTGWSPYIDLGYFMPKSGTKETYRYDLSSLFDATLSNSGELISVGWGLGWTAENAGVQASLYNLKSRTVAPLETAISVSPGYFPLFVHLTPEGILGSYGYFDPSTQGLLSPLNQQIVFQKKFK